MDKRLRYIILTALYIALAVVFQQLRAAVPKVGLIWGLDLQTIVIGSLVNVALLIAAGTLGFISGAAVAVITPVVALIQGHLQLPALLPVVIAGNLLLVLIFWAFGKKLRLPGMIAATIAKTAGMWAVLNFAVGPLFLKGPQIAAITPVLITPQVPTAIIGGIIALAILPMLDKALARGRS